jgi:hypothetical protein
MHRESDNASYRVCVRQGSSSIELMLATIGFASHYVFPRECYVRRKAGAFDQRQETCFNVYCWRIEIKLIVREQLPGKKKEDKSTTLVNVLPMCISRPVHSSSL